MLLGVILALFGLLIALIFAPTAYSALVIPATLLLVVTGGCLTGSMLPLIFQRLGLDPALMANPFIAGIMDIMGILIYVNIARLLLGAVAT
jgi:magnesium transporter